MNDFPELPGDFPHKGKFRRWDSAWNILPPEQWADEPQHSGQQPVRFPLEWTPAQCFMRSPFETTDQSSTGAPA